VTGRNSLPATPDVTVSFVWADSAAGRVLQAPALQRLAPHVFTTRDLTFRGDRRPDDVARLARAMGTTPAGVITVRQVHGRVVLTVRPGDEVRDTADADAIVSTDPTRAVAVRVADCVPILLANRDRRVVAAVHAGWRGTSVGVAQAAVEAIGALGVPAASLTAAIGPSIGPCCYQVDARVRDAYRQDRGPAADGWFSPDGPDRWRLDLWRANGDELVAAGVPAREIHVARYCTADHAETCFSYRRDGDSTGRMMAAIRLGG